MRSSSLEERIEWLERELPPNRPRFKIHDELPFAILRYDPEEEWALRREVGRLATRLRNRGLEPAIISMAELFWRSIEETEGIETVARLERESGFRAAQRQVRTYLTDEDFRPLGDMLVERLEALDSERGIGLVTRVASLAPDFYNVSQLLERIQGRTDVPAVVFYPGCLEGAGDLRFMCLPTRDIPPTYRVKIYG